MSPALRHTLVEGDKPQRGRFDAIRLAKALDLSVPEMAAVLGYTPRGIRANPDSKNLQAKLRELVSLVIRLMEELDGSMEHIRIRPHAPHPDLDGVPPYEELLEAPRDLVLSPAQGTAYRLSSVKHMTSQFAIVGTFKTSGRYNKKGQFAALYLADTPRPPWSRCRCSSSPTAA